MPEINENYVAVLNALGETLSKFNSTLSQQSIGSIVGTFDGHSSKCKEWINSIEKFAEIYHFNDEARIDAALLTARSSVEDFIRRWRKANPTPRTWLSLSTALTSHFGTIVDSNHAFDLLRRIKQGPTENISLYAERIYRLSHDAYTTLELSNESSYAMAQRQLVNVFIDGLLDRSIKLKVMRSGPNTLDEALKIARNEVNILQRFDLRNGSHRFERPDPEPMDVSHIRTRTCHTCGKAGHISRDCSVRTRPTSKRSRCLICDSPNHSTNSCGRQNYRKNVHAVENNKQIICYNCGMPGHFKRQCTQRSGYRHASFDGQTSDRSYAKKNEKGFRH